MTPEEREFIGNTESFMNGIDQLELEYRDQINASTTDLDERRYRNAWPDFVSPHQSSFDSFVEQWCRMGEWQDEQAAINDCFVAIQKLWSRAIEIGFDAAHGEAAGQFDRLREEFRLLTVLTAEQMEIQLDPDASTEEVNHRDREVTRQGDFVIALSDSVKSKLNEVADELRILIRELDGPNEEIAQSELGFLRLELEAIADRLGSQDHPGYHPGEVSAAAHVVNQLSGSEWVVAANLSLTFSNLGILLFNLARLF